MDIAMRLDEAMRAAGFKSQSALARASGVPQPTINRILKGGGKRGPETETVRKLAEALNVSFQWLLEGKEPRGRLVDDPNTIEGAFREIPDPLLLHGERRSSPREFELPSGAFWVSPDKRRSVGAFGKGRGGMTDRDYSDSDFPTGESDKYAEVGTSDPNAFLTLVDDHSMYPKYTHSDYALVEPNTEIELEDDVLVKFKTFGPILKRLLSRKGGVVRLGSYNNTEVVIQPVEDIVWMYYVAHPVPAKRIKSRF
jgi:transcriptional regulator with XRE-family HTH domain